MLWLALFRRSDPILVSLLCVGQFDGRKPSFLLSCPSFWSDLGSGHAGSADEPENQGPGAGVSVRPVLGRREAAVNLRRRVGPTRALDFGLRAHVEVTEARNAPDLRRS